MSSKAKGVGPLYCIVGLGILTLFFLSIFFFSFFKKQKTKSLLNSFIWLHWVGLAVLVLFHQPQHTVLIPQMATFTSSCLNCYLKVAVFSLKTGKNLMEARSDVSFFPPTLDTFNLQRQLASASKPLLTQSMCSTLSVCFLRWAGTFVFWYRTILRPTVKMSVWSKAYSKTVQITMYIIDFFVGLSWCTPLHWNITGYNKPENKLH